MDSDALRRAWSGSTLVRGGRRVARAFQAAARSSAVAAGAAQRRRNALALSPAARVRLAGLLALTAVATDEVLLRLVPSHLRPAPPGAPALVIAAVAILVIALAPHLVRAWPSSALKQYGARRL
jgi:hypothetical protein